MEIITHLGLLIKDIETHMLDILGYTAWTWLSNYGDRLSG